MGGGGDECYIGVLFQLITYFWHLVIFSNEFMGFKLEIMRVNDLTSEKVFGKLLNFYPI